MRTIVVSFLLLSTAAFAFRGPSAKPTFAKDVKPTLQKYCVGCHAGPYAPDKVDLAKIKTEADAKKHLKMLQKGLHEVEENKMPPKGSPKPTAAQLKAFKAWIKAQGSARTK